MARQLLNTRHRAKSDTALAGSLARLVRPIAMGAFSAAAAVLTNVALTERVAAETWNGTIGFWNVAANWTPATVPNAIDATATFDAVNPGVSFSVNLTGGPFTVGTLNLNSSVAVGGYHFQQGTLIMQVSAGSAAINVQSSNFTNDFSSDTTLQLNSNTVITTASSTARLTVDGLVAGAGALTIAGPGTVILNHANTYTSGTTITSGTLAIGDADALGTGNVSFTTAAGALRSDITGTLTNAIEVFAGGTSRISAANGQTLTLTGALALHVGAAGMQFGEAGGTGTVVLDGGVGVIGGGVAANFTVDVLGGTLRGDSFTLDFFASFATATNIAAGATIDFADAGGATVRNLQSAGTVVISGPSLLVGGGQSSGPITGAGALTVATPNSLVVPNTGLLVLTGTNTYAGGTTIQTGATLQLGAGGTTGSILGNVANSGTLAFNRSDAVQFDGVVSGAGALRKDGAGALNLTGNNTYTGNTTVNAGLLAVNGSTASSALTTVNAGGLLGGNGTVGNTTINGGTLAPGNSIGLLTVQGSLVFTAASSYLVEVSPTNADRTNVTGTATLGGATVNANFAAGSYVQKKYTILNAASISGTFGSIVNTNLPGSFQSSLSYDANNTYLNLQLALAQLGGLNRNQQNVANTLTNFFNATGGIPLVFGTLTPAGLSQVSGETATGSQQTTFNAMNQFMGVMTDPFIAGRGDPVSGGGNPNAYTEDSLAYAAKRKPNDALAAIYTKAPPIVQNFEQRWSVWAAGFGGSQTTDGNTVLGSNNTRSSLAAGAVGADYRLSPNTLAGFALAGGGTSFSVNGAGSGRSDLFQAGAFIRHNVGPAYITGALAYGWQDVTTDRTVTVAGIDQLRAKFNANAWSGRVEGGYRFVSQGFGWTPYAAGQFTTFELPAYTEQAIVGANTFALAYNAKSVTSTRSELGLRTDKSFAVPNGIFTLRGRAAWAHDYNPDRSIGATFQTLPGASFVVNGARQAADAALVTGSAEMKWLNGWSIAGTFEGEFSKVTESYAGKGVVRYAW
ncbi:autotransporter outer membrane beta-barrel domain-containing protein [Bradyrhizobium sp. JYMT SZCCT0180]|uniref:autotransporter outer membrane beta-barrel domain-containing protein n=1 Tax=Bradyrhizobium sp. JYMT SZCCT0180 TaxID=2807666 RepID=UPI001BA65853|nr:autotransporter outer membrane beta-barrel domain-containing protein [Bradyrhizobium sp. JYMT SZCCT0180]MBR1211978.1 autotransporter domain-containing protein [Bradyrhizobium sp. JYMT SZCCT0180]